MPRSTAFYFARITRSIALYLMSKEGNIYQWQYIGSYFAHITRLQARYLLYTYIRNIYHLSTIYISRVYTLQEWIISSASKVIHNDVVVIHIVIHNKIYYKNTYS